MVDFMNNEKKFGVLMIVVAIVSFTIGYLTF